MTITVGRFVHFVLPSGEHRPALVVRTWSETCVNLQVFFDGPQENPQGTGLTGWCTSVTFDKEKGRGTWHWPELA